MTQMQLLRLHVAALYTLDENDRLLFVNEPWDKTIPAPLLYLGKTAGGEAALYCRAGLAESLRAQAEALFSAGVTEPGAYLALFQGAAAVEELCYCFPGDIPAGRGCERITRYNLPAFDFSLFPWLSEEIFFVKPCFAFVEGEKIVSLCRSVRMAAAHEAGIETAPAYRGKGCGKEALLCWAEEVARLGATPLYSARKSNRASQRLAYKAGLVPFAEGFHIEQGRK